MSFDLYVWHEPSRISADEALAKVMQFGEGDPTTFVPHPSVSVFYRDLLRLFPALEDESRAVVKVWSGTPEHSDSLVELPIQLSHVAEVVPIVTGLAAAHGLVCFDPQNDAMLETPT